jgi:hypothetical protein
MDESFLVLFFKKEPLSFRLLFRPHAVAGCFIHVNRA